MCILLQEEVKAAKNSHGRQFANRELYPRLNGKVKLEQFIYALESIGNVELANKLKG